MAKLAAECKTYDDNRPMDYEFENKLNASVNDNQQPQLEISKDPLYIDRRQARVPLSACKSNTTTHYGGMSFDPFRPAPEYTSQPKNQNEERLINRQLQPDELRQVQVGATTITIDNIFVGAQR